MTARAVTYRDARNRTRTYRTTTNPPHRARGAKTERSRAEPPKAPDDHEYAPGWCANGCGTRDVAPTQLDAGGPYFKLCRVCNGQAEEVRRPQIERGHEPPTQLFTGDFRKQVALATKRITGRDGIYNTPLGRSQTSEVVLTRRAPGHVRFLVAATVDGKARDRHEAEATFAHQPWAAEARYIGNARGHFIWDRPDAALMARLRREHDDTLETTTEQLERLRGDEL